MEYKDILVPLMMMAMFIAFIYAIVEVIKGAVFKPVQFFIEIFNTTFRGKDISPGTAKTLMFVVALIYCKTFEFDIMTWLMKVHIDRDNGFAWWLAYIGTASVAYVGVDKFLGYINDVRKKVVEKFNKALKEQAAVGDEVKETHESTERRVTVEKDTEVSK